MRLIVVVVLLVMVVALGGVLVLGAFPPSPRTEQIQRVLPNDRFQTR
jgi:hypothetical protein